MKYLSEAKYKSRLRKIELNNKSKERKQKLREEKRKYGLKLKLPATSKLVLLVVFLMCIEILIFSQYAMIKLGDINAMYALISVPVSLVPVSLAYMWKSKAENTSGGIVYERSMHELNQINYDAQETVCNDDICDDGTVG